MPVVANVNSPVLIFVTFGFAD